MPRDIPESVSARRAWFWVAAAAVIISSGFAQAAEPSPPAASGPVARKAFPPAAAEKLKSSDPDRIREGLEDARLAGKNAASLAAEITALLDRGLNTPLAEAALQALGELEIQATNPSIAPYLSHRDPKVRIATANALSRTKGAAAVASLRRALSDSDAGVRSAAASGLGLLRARDAFGDLVIALDHRVASAAAPIGQLCSVDECNDFLGRIGRLPFDLMASGLDALLFRPMSEVSEDTKANVIGRVRELKTNEVHEFLESLQKRWPLGASPRLRALIDQAVKATIPASGP